MFQKMLYDWFFKALEIVGVAFIGYGLFILIERTFATLWAIIGISIIFWFFTPIIKPYLDIVRKWIYKKWTGIDEETF